MYRSVVCTICRGDGTLYVLDQSEEGRIYRKRIMRCPACNGTGLVLYPHRDTIERDDIDKEE